MAAFPTLNPSSRTYSPGEYPHSPFTGMSGVQNRVRNSNVMVASQLRLAFVGITEAQMLSILAHYQGQLGSFQSFGLPSAIWSGTDDPANYQLSGYGWRYIEPPSVSDAMCADAYDVELALETVPPEGTALLGLNSIVQFSIVGGIATAANGANLTVTVSIEYGAGVAAGLAETVSASLAAGAATTDATPPAFNRLVAWNITGGTATGGVSAGLEIAIPWSLAAGTATGSNPIAALSPVLWYDFSDESTVTVSSSQITQITDKGSRGWTLTKSSTGPGYVTGINGLKCVDWGTANHINYLQNTDTTSTAMAEAFIVLDAAFGSTFSGYPGLITSAVGTVWTVSGDSGYTRFYPGVQPFDSAFINNSGTNQYSTVLPGINSPCLLRLKKANNTAYTNTAGFQVGRDRTYTSTGRGWLGLIGEIVVFSSVLSSTDRATVQNHLANKWGITLV